MNKKSQSSTALVLVILVVAIAIFFLMNNKTSDQNSLLTVGKYDAQGNQLFSVVGGTPGVAQIDFTVKVTNTGNTPLTCNLGIATPAALNSAFTKTTQTVQPGNYITWTSAKMAASQFESTVPSVFTESVTCTYLTGTTTNTVGPKSGTVTIQISPDATGNFDIVLNPGGTSFSCGDGSCNSPTETASNCPADCSVSSRVKFRTTDLTYPSTSHAIAITNTCGNTLTPLGSSSSVAPHTGTCVGQFGTSSYIDYGVIPGNIGMTGGADTHLYCQTSLGYCWICDDDGTSFRYTVYSSSDSDKSLVSTSPNSIDSTKEVAC